MWLFCSYNVAMLNDATNLRRQRGLEIAATTAIVRKGDEWIVPSQSLNGKYRVMKAPEGFRCTCPDFELRGETCKHGFAVEFFVKRETKPDGTVVETRAARVTYAQNWPAYNRAQVSEKDTFCALLRDLVADIPSPEQKRGRPSLPLNDMLFAAAYKVYSTVSARRFMTDLRAATTNGHIGKTPHYNSIFNLLDNESLTPVLQDLITRSALPLRALETSFAVDSTGFGVQSFYRHYSAKYGHDEVWRDFVKVHAMIGTTTNVVTAVEVTDRDQHDGPMMPGLVNKTAKHFNVEQVSADKAYSSRQNLATCEYHGATPFVPFKTNAVGNSDSPMWNRLFHFFHLHKDEFLSKYHARSNAESTFSAMKRKFSDTIRSKTPVAQRNEALLKVLCHNIVCVIHEMHESGAVTMFPALVPVCPKTTGAAQQPLGWE
jgi:transposase